MSGTQDSTVMKALVVDDDSFIRDLTVELLHQLGLTTVATAADGTEALALEHLDGPFDLVMCDLDMQGMDGMQLLRHLAERRFTGSLVVMTGAGTDVLATAADLAHLHGLRLAAALRKPVNADELDSVLERIRHGTTGDRSTVVAGADRDLLTVDDLREGLAEGRAGIHVQPKVTVRDRRVVGAEALLRWRDGSGSLLPPSLVIPVAEANGLLHPLTLTVFEQAVRALADWRAAGLDLRVSVNLAHQSLATLSMPDDLVRLAQESGVEAGHVTLEIGQAAIAENPSVVMEIIGRLRLKGFGVAVDDFGSTIARARSLSDLPITELKVDRTLIGGTSHASLTELLSGHKPLGVPLVAQGVETADVVALLESLGCDEMQGYLVARPMPVAEFASWVRQWNATWNGGDRHVS